MKNNNYTMILKHQKGDKITALCCSEIPKLHFYVATWIGDQERKPTMELPRDYSRTRQMTYDQALKTYKLKTLI